MIRGSSGFWLSNVLLARARMSTKPKPPSHYQALEIDSRSTQAQIKSAFFELSKQYHPDKNSSVEAVVKFRKIREAYEVLGNYKTRRIYDRGLMVKSRPGGDRHHPADSNDDPKMKYYQAQAAVFKDTKRHGSAAAYNFDAWTKAHYGEVFQRIRADRAQADAKRQTREEFAMSKPETDGGMVLLGVSLVFVTLLMYFHAREPSYDGVYETWVWEKTIDETQSSKESRSSNDTARLDSPLSS